MFKQIRTAYTDESINGTILRLGTVIIMVCLTMCAIAAVAIAIESSEVPDTTAKHAPRVCFPAKRWGPAPKRYAPCVRVTHVSEDGSFSFAVSDKGGTVRYTSGAGALDR
jgi:hypothetical protein